MVVIITGLNRVVELIDNNFDIGTLGTGTAVEARTDGGLAAGTATTQITMTTTTASKFLQKSYTLPPTSGNGASYAEWSIVSSTATSGTAFNRVTFEPLSKVVGDQWTIRNRFFVRERNR